MTALWGDKEAGTALPALEVQGGETPWPAAVAGPGCGPGAPNWGRLPAQVSERFQKETTSGELVLLTYK